MEVDVSVIQASSRAGVKRRSSLTSSSYGNRRAGPLEGGVLRGVGGAWRWAPSPGQAWACVRGLRQPTQHRHGRGAPRGTGGYTIPCTVRNWQRGREAAPIQGLELCRSRVGAPLRPPWLEQAGQGAWRPSPGKAGRGVCGAAPLISVHTTPPADTDSSVCPSLASSGWPWKEAGPPWTRHRV